MVKKTEVPQPPKRKEAAPAKQQQPPPRPPQQRQPSRQRRTPEDKSTTTRQRALRLLLRLINQRVIALPLIILVLLFTYVVLNRTGQLPGGSGGDHQNIDNPNAPLASFYAPEVLKWRSDIERWAHEYDVNPNVIAIVMQIKSCGNSSVISGAGATGLMQVMPFHFDDGENMLNPDVNVRNGMDVFYECLTQFADWDLGIALACYNGGPSVTLMDSSSWPAETQAYYHWASGMWNEAQKNRKDSDTLNEWLSAGGQNLCSLSAQNAQ